MEDEINTLTSFHGRLSRFAYTPPSSSSSSLLLSAPRTPDKEEGVRKHNWAKKVSDELDGEEYRNQVGRGANLLSESRKRKSKHLLGCGSNSPKLKRSKAKNTAAAAPKVYAHLEAVLPVLDCVAHDLDGTYHTHSMTNPDLFSLFLTLFLFFFPRAVLFCGIKYVRVVDLRVLKVSLIAGKSKPICSPGKMSAERGHHYANPTNHFWHCLHHSGAGPVVIRANDLMLRLDSNKGSRRGFCFLRKMPRFQKSTILGL
jgi:hypothetical protein